MKKPFLTIIVCVGSLMAGMTNAQTCTNKAMGESTPTSNFTFNMGGTVTDNTTGLMWKRCMEGEIFSDSGTPNNYLDDRCTGEWESKVFTWQAALKQAQTANGKNDNGHNDWRVPDLKELQSIVEYCRISPAINTDVFPGWSVWYTWSSTAAWRWGSIGSAWRVAFAVGSSDTGGFSLGATHVRLVRSGQ